MDTYGQYAATRQVGEKPAGSAGRGGVGVSAGAIRTLEGVDLVTGMPVLVYTLPGPPPELPFAPSEHLLGALEWGEADGGGYLVVASVPGLARLRPVVPPDRLAWLARGSARALRDAHAAGLVHRDLRPERFLASGDTLLIEGFGLPWADEKSPYRPPEGAGRPAADVFAWARCLQALGTGEPTRLLGGELGRLVGHCQNGRPRERPTAAELVQALEQLEHLEQVERTPSRAAPPRPSEVALEAAPPIEAAVDTSAAEAVSLSAGPPPPTEPAAQPAVSQGVSPEAEATALEPAPDAHPLEPVVGPVDPPSAEPPEPAAALSVHSPAASALEVPPTVVPTDAPVIVEARVEPLAPVAEVAAEPPESEAPAAPTLEPPAADVLVVAPAPQAVTVVPEPPAEPPQLPAASAREPKAAEPGEPRAAAAAPAVPELVRKPVPNAPLEVREFEVGGPSAQLPAPRRRAQPVKIGWQEDDSWRRVKAPPPPPPRRRLPVAAVALVLALACLAGLVFLLRRGGSASPAAQPAAAPAAPAGGAVITFRLEPPVGRTGRLTALEVPPESELRAGDVVATVPGPVLFSAPGRYRLRVSLAGFEPKDFALTVSRSQDVVLQLEERR